jgi:hypothetical protein
MNKMQRYKILGTLAIVLLFLEMVFIDNKIIYDALSLILTGVSIMTFFNNKTI